MQITHFKKLAIIAATGALDHISRKMQNAYKEEKYESHPFMMALIAELFVTSAQADSEISAKERDHAIGEKDGRTAEEVIEAIDSLGWNVNPIDFGMTAMDYGSIHASGQCHFGTQSARSPGGIGIAIPYPWR